MAYTILVIDGIASQRDMLLRSLQGRLGYQVISCSSAREAETCFSAGYASAPPDLMLLDWTSASGMEAMQRLTAFHALAPLVVLVKYGDYDAGVAALNAGAWDFLTKPVATERLNATFRNLLLFRDTCRELERLRISGGHSAQTDGSARAFPPLPLVDKDGNVRRMSDIESEAIRFAMQHYHGHMTEVARRLGIGRSTLYRKLNGLGVRPEEVAA